MAFRLPRWMGWPEGMPRFVIASKAGAERMLRDRFIAGKVTHLVSIASPYNSRQTVWTDPRPPRGMEKVPNGLRMVFDDIERPADEYPFCGEELTPPTPDDAKAIMEFLRSIGPEDLALIHCQAGMSRSAACGYALAALHVGLGREAHRLAESASTSGCYSPNTLLVKYFEDLLKRRTRA